MRFKRLNKLGKLQWKVICGGVLMYGILLTAVVFYLICTAYLGYISIEKLKKITITESERIHKYSFAAVWNLVSTALVFLAVWITPITFYDIGFRRIHFNANNRLLLIATLLVCGLLTVLFLYQIFAFILSASYRNSTASSLQQRRQSGGLYQKVVDNLIPRTRKEKRWYGMTALAAGFCEEVVFRGFLFYLLSTVFPRISSYLMVILVGLLFGLAHFYQGIKGILKTALLGALFGLLFVETNSLILCIILHFLFDFSSAFLYQSYDK